MSTSTPFGPPPEPTDPARSAARGDGLTASTARRGPNVVAIVVALLSYAVAALVVVDRLLLVDVTGRIAPVVAMLCVGGVLVTAGGLGFVRRRSGPPAAAARE